MKIKNYLYNGDEETQAESEESTTKSNNSADHPSTHVTDVLFDE